MDAFIITLFLAFIIVGVIFLIIYIIEKHYDDNRAIVVEYKNGEIIINHIINYRYLSSKYLSEKRFLKKSKVLLKELRQYLKEHPGHIDEKQQQLLKKRFMINTF